MIAISRVHFPVGQGGFSTSVIELPGSHKEFVAVFDCGATSSGHDSPLSDAIRMFCRNHHVIDSLFLSHFHADHVNGLDLLLGEIDRVEYVYIPYVNAIDMLALAAAEALAGRFSSLVREFCENPVVWLQRRRCANVVMVQSPPDGTPPPDMGPIIEPDRGEDRTEPAAGEEIRQKSGRPLGENKDGDHSQEGGSFGGALLDPGDKINLRTNSRELNWIFIPYCFPADRAKLRLFAKALQSLADPGRSIKDLISSRPGRERVKRAYLNIFPDKQHNRTSMSVYEGPRQASSAYYARATCDYLGYFSNRFRFLPYPLLRKLRNNSASKIPLALFELWVARRVWPRHLNESRLHATNHVASIRTGDADLAVPKVRDDFFRFFEKCLPFSSSASVPHHGSRDNFDRQTLLGFRAISFFYVTCRTRTRSKDHPSKEVVKLLRQGKKELIRVGDKRDQCLLEWILST